MPPFLGPGHFYFAVQNEAIPTLERLAENDGLHDRSLRRFERDEPPPYASSTDEAEELDDDFPLPQPDGRLPEQIRDIIESRLTDDEISSNAHALRFATDPAACYRREAQYEEDRLDDYRPYLLNPLFREKKFKNSNRRRDVLIRHYIKRRWEKLGIWNPEWGIPVRNQQPNDNINKWKWRWEQHNTDSSGSGGSEQQDDLYYKRMALVKRALLLRQNLHRGEASPVVPRSHLAPDATASEAESFIISRPWFIYKVEICEEQVRFCHRLDSKQLNSLNHSGGRQVRTWWKERGDWKENFNMPNGDIIVSSWKWRHESPSPEPEDLTPISNMKDSLLDAEDMEFTPSEIDALESIPPPGYISPPPPPPPIEMLPREPHWLFGPFPPKEAPTEDQHDEPYKEAEEEPLEPQQDTSHTPPQATSQQRRGQPQNTGRDTAPEQLPRRSARIATYHAGDSTPEKEDEVSPNPGVKRGGNSAQTRARASEEERIEHYRHNGNSQDTRVYQNEKR